MQHIYFMFNRNTRLFLQDNSREVLNGLNKFAVKLLKV